MTRIPAAANAAVALAYWVPGEAIGSAIQLVINLSAIVVAGTAPELGADVVDASLLGNGGSGTAVVTSQHHQGDAELPQHANGVGRLGTDLVTYSDSAQQSSLALDEYDGRAGILQPRR